MEMPQWAGWADWSRPVTVVDLNVDRSVIPDWPGFYAFTPDPAPLRVDHVLYIGETKNLRNRLPAYLVHDPRRSTTVHKGALFIHDHRIRKANDKSVWVRWWGWESDARFRRQIEAAMIQFYATHYNIRDRGVDTFDVD